MRTVDVLLHLLKAGLIAIAVILLVIASDAMDNHYKYPEVAELNKHHRDTLEALTVELPVHYYDWEETAHSLGVSMDSLTIDMFLTHLSQ